MAQNQSIARSANGRTKLEKLHEEKVLPHNAEAERALLGAILVNPETLVNVGDTVKRDDFFVEQNRHVFGAAEELYAAGKAIDLITLSENLNSREKLEAAGGSGYISQLMDGVPHVSNAVQYARLVRDDARRRKLIHLCALITESAYGASSVKKLLERSTAALGDIVADSEAMKPEKWSVAASRATEEMIKSIKKPEANMRMKCGIDSVDDITSGLRRQELVLVVGQTSHGKSTLAMQYATQADSDGLKGLIFSAEMSSEALARRELAHTAGIQMYLVRRPENIRRKEEAIERLMEACAKESRRNLLVVDRDITPNRVKILSQLVQRTSGLDFIIVDYDQLVIRGGGASGDEQFSEQIRFVSDALEIAKKLNICYVLLCQPRKVDADFAKGKRGPRVEDIWGSSAAANSAHLIMWLVRKYFQKGMQEKYKHDAMLYVLKSRNDQTQYCELEFDTGNVVFKDRPSEKNSEEEGNGES